MPEKPILTPEHIETRIEAIRKMADDGENEEAHSAEDGLRAVVLQAIADGRAEDPRLCAFVALKTREIDFARWYA